MENIKNDIDTFSATMNLIESTLGKAVFERLNQTAKKIILDTLQQELQKDDNRDLLQVCKTSQLSQTTLGHSLSGATRVKPLLLKGSINPLRVRGRNVATGD
jgi:hypothetical protein